ACQAVERVQARGGRLPADGVDVGVAGTHGEAVEHGPVGDAIALEEGRLVLVQVSVLPSGVDVAPLTEGGYPGGRRAVLQRLESRRGPGRGARGLPVKGPPAGAGPSARGPRLRAGPGVAAGGAPRA